MQHGPRYPIALKNLEFNPNCRKTGWPDWKANLPEFCTVLTKLSIFLIIPVAELPIDYVDSEKKFFGARAVTSASGQGAIVQMWEHFYEVTCEISICSWSILAQKLDLGVAHAVMMTLPPEYTSKCDSCTAGFFGNFCQGK